LIEKNSGIGLATLGPDPAQGASAAVEGRRPERFGRLDVFLINKGAGIMATARFRRGPAEIESGEPLAHTTYLGGGRAHNPRRALPVHAFF